MDNQCNGHKEEKHKSTHSIQNKLAPFNPTSTSGISTALKLLQLSPNDTLLDIGCGDGRLLIEACKSTPNVQCYGIEYDEVFYNRANTTIQIEGLKDSVTIIHGDIVDVYEEQRNEENNWFYNINAIFLYLVPDGVRKIKNMLEEIIHQSKKKHDKIRIVTYMFSISYWDPICVERTDKGCPVYYYEV